MWILEPLLITKAERQRLEHVVRAHKSPQRMVRRARAVLLAAEGWPNRRIATEAGVSENSVGLWRRRFDQHRTAGLAGTSRSGPARPSGHQRPPPSAAALR